MNMFRSICAGALLVIAACASPPEDAVPFPSVETVAKNTAIWDVGEKFGPVYFGTIHAYDSGGTYDESTIEDCLTIAYVKMENGRVHYIHKLWEPENGDCKFADLDSKPKGLETPECFVEPDSTKGTRALTPEALSLVKLDGVYSRQLDVGEQEAGFIEACTEAEPSILKAILHTIGLSSADVFELRYEEDKLTMHTNPIFLVEWIYKINLNYINVFDENPAYPAGTGL